MKNMSEGRVTFASRNHYTVSSSGGEYICVLAGAYSLHNDYVPAVGDYVSFYANPDGNSVIDAVRPRKSVVARKASGREYDKAVLAANVDVMLIVCAMDRNFSRNRIERFLVLAESGGARPVVVLTKSDLCSPMDIAVYTMGAEEAVRGTEVFAVSSVTGDGLKELSDILVEGVTACAVGLSGAGKSSLLNRLTGHEIQTVSGVRADDDKGKHTTTSRHLFKLPSGADFIDTPGIREVGMTGDAEALDAVFDDITEAAADCFFADCTHTHEPGCAVKKLAESGEIDMARYENYLKLRNENENYIMRTQDKAGKKREEKKLSRTIKNVIKIKPGLKDS